MVLLVHDSSTSTFSRVFDLEQNDLEPEDCPSRKGCYEGRFPVNAGITGYVAATGEVVNIENAHEDPRSDVFYFHI